MTRVLISVGTDCHPFRRAAEWARLLIREGHAVRAQLGSAYENLPGAECAERLPHSAMSRWIQWSEFIIAHAGPGTVRDAVAFERPVVVVPRLPEYGEHIDKHQVRFAQFLERRGIRVAYEYESISAWVAQSEAHGPMLDALRTVFDPERLETSVSNVGRVVERTVERSGVRARQWGR